MAVTLNTVIFYDQAVKTGIIYFEHFHYLNQHQSQTIFFNCDHCFYCPTRSKVPEMVLLSRNYWIHRSVRYKKDNSFCRM